MPRCARIHSALKCITTLLSYHTCCVKFGILSNVLSNFLQEAYHRITTVVGHPISFIAAKFAGNLSKNRSKDILPNDSTRVRIRTRAVLSVPEEGHDYINANTLEYPLPGAPPLQYIATQGPLKSTIVDFWTMVWEQKIGVIVMLTELLDAFGREACAHYWPASDTATYGEFRVDVTHVDKLVDYTVTSLALTDGPSGETRTVYHVQYFAWPDFGVPADPRSVLRLHRCVRGLQRNTGDDHPLLAHCTGGLGRTGAYILIDIMLRQLVFNAEPNAENILMILREQRCGLVQTEDQFEFALRVALEQLKADMSPQTAVPLVE